MPRRFPLRASIRLRTTLLATAVVAIALVAAAVALVVLQRQTLRGNVDDTVRARSNDIASLLESGALPAQISVADPEIAIVQVANASGAVVASTTNVAGLQLLFDHRPEAGEEDLFDAGELPVDDEQFRVLARRVEGPEGPRILYVAASLEPVSESVESLVEILRAGIPLMVLAVAAGTWVVVGRSLRPIEAIRREVDDISLAHLDRRVPVPASCDEVARLARTMNDLLARLEAARAREEQFVADAAHELRSPLASLRAQLEVSGRGAAGSGKELAATLGEDVARLQALAENLLLLTSLDARREPERTLVDFDDIVLEEARAVALPDGKRMTTRGVSAAAVRGDPAALRRLVRNLLENAIRHATSTVTLALRETDTAVQLRVEDDGPGIAPEDRERVFERFVQLDQARSGGAGLGLAICRAVAEAHGGTIETHPVQPHGAAFVTVLPK
jgi:signal transduction histidine kinase